jgi:hypothetical protein
MIGSHSERHKMEILDNELEVEEIVSFEIIASSRLSSTGLSRCQDLVFPPTPKQGEKSDRRWPHVSQPASFEVAVKSVCLQADRVEGDGLHDRQRCLFAQLVSSQADGMPRRWKDLLRLSASAGGGGISASLA